MSSDARRVVEAIARPAVLFGDLLEAQDRRSGIRSSARGRVPRVARCRGREPGARGATVLWSHGVNDRPDAVAGSTSASRRPCGSTSDSVRSPKRVSIGIDARAVLLEARCPSTRGCPSALRARPRPRAHGPIRGGAICAHGKNVKSVPGMAFRVGIEEVIRARVVLIDALLDQSHPEDAAVEVEVLLRGPGDGGDVVQAVDGSHVRDFRSGQGSRLKAQGSRPRSWSTVLEGFAEP